MTSDTAKLSEAIPAEAGVFDRLPGHWQRALIRMAWAGWVIFAIVIAARAAVHPDKNSVSGVYSAACQRWWGGEEIYNDYHNGFIYLPHAALVYTPFYLLPQRAGESLYRVAIIAMFAWSVWRITRLAATHPMNEYFPIVTLISIGVGAGSALNGQYNLPLAATLIFATCALVEKRWWWACFWLTCSILLKPIAIASVLLALVLYRPLWWRMPLVGLLVLGIPFLCSIRDPGYAAGEYKTFWDTVIRATLPLERRFAEFSTVLYWFGLDLGNGARQAVRAVAAVVTLGLCFVATRRSDALRAGLLIWAFGVTYLMIFNPRTEGATYAIMGPTIGLFGALEFDRLSNPAWRRAVGMFFLAMGILMIFVHEILPRSGAYYEMAQGSKDLLVRPIICMVFYSWLVWLSAFDRTARKARISPSAPAFP